MGQKPQEALATHVSGQSNKPMSKPAHSLSFDDVLRELGGSGLDGLSESEAAKRGEEYGKNELDNGPGVNPTMMLVGTLSLLDMQVTDNSQVLILAMAVSFGIGSYIEGGVVAGIIIINIFIGFMQEYSAEKTMDSLRSLSSPTSSVIRGGNGIVVPTISVVPGDMVELKTGGKVPVWRLLDRN
jgi:P-type Na+/K+ transporter